MIQVTNCHEEWKEIFLKNIYVSSWGQVKQEGRVYKDGRGGTIAAIDGLVHQRRIGKNCKEPNHYKCVRIKYDGFEHQILVHRLVAIAFIPNTENKPFVNHIDGVKWNNFYLNLEWVTAKENSMHAYHVTKAFKGFKPKHGAEIFLSKLTDEKVLDIRKMANEGIATKEIAHKYSIHPGNIRYIVRGKTWKHLL